MRTAIVNLDKIVTGDLAVPFASGDGILMEDGRITAVGTLPADKVAACDVVVDADRTIAIPGLIDSQVHVTFGDYTPRQKTVGYLESYVHGGTTTSISASEIHVPGRPKDAAGLKALALAARACFRDYRPGGMKVHAGSIILEPDMTEADLEELVAQGLWLAKAGFGAFKTSFDYAPLMLAARRLGMITTIHTGNATSVSSHGIWAEHVLACNPTVSFHTNGGPAAMPEEGFARLVDEAPEVALQLCTAGNLRTALLTARLLDEAGQPERLLIATDTPNGSGIMPLGMFYTISHLASLGGMPPEQAIAAATGNNARVYRLNCGLLQVGKDADVVLIDACLGSSKNDGLSALSNGDVPSAPAVFIDGVPRFVGHSRNTPVGIRNVRVAHSTLPRDYSGVAP